MKPFYFLLFLLIKSISFGQIPLGYYDSATGSGYTLKSQLKSIIDDINDLDFANIGGWETKYKISALVLVVIAILGLGYSADVEFWCESD